MQGRKTTVKTVRRAPLAVRRAPLAVRRAPLAVRRAPLAGLIAALLAGPVAALADAPTALASLDPVAREKLEHEYLQLLAEIEAVEREQAALDAQIAHAAMLDGMRGAGDAAGEAAAAQDQVHAPAQSRSQASAPAEASASSAPAAAQRAAGAGGAAGTAGAASGGSGSAPVVAADRQAEYEEQQSMPELPRVSSDVGGVLTPKGRLVLEPSFGYTYSSVNRVAIEGFTIIPALLIGVIDIVEADRQTYSTSLSARYGLTNRLEMELKGSYVYRDDNTRSREFLKDSVQDSIFNATGEGAGDYELGLRYQFKRRSPTGPYLVGNLRYKGDNGTDPFQIATQSQLTGAPEFSSTLPTGSGFKSLSPSVSFIYPSDPVVFFGSLGYMWTEEDDKGTSFDAEGNVVGFGRVDPGDALRMSFGLGLGLNDRSSLSISYALDRFSKTWIETAAEQEIAGSDVTVGKLLVGYSMKLAGGAPLNIAFGVGTTGDAPDTDLSFRMPFNLRN